eukprot:CAMPEP_0174242770 /NCGR_PEP_ID=MMETSP0417-20130205/29106_1 /TAXON_ID=242541 /ORGANISM="Mayorella sp, Strain BSH-02190019" /LENGTH=520 /DNA_ID=CAMNT_0015322197 /DNA_START=90 /DNA_END=1652 /DNA_ORIENTATION=-
MKRLVSSRSGSGAGASSSSASASAGKKGTTLSMYDVPPTEEIKLDEFESFALDRLRVLKELSAVRVRGISKADTDARIREVTNKYLPLLTQEDLRKDNISHHVLRLAYCRQDREWFVHQEADLLKYRLAIEGVGSFLRHNSLEHTPVQVSADEFQTYRSELQACFPRNLDSLLFTHSNYYKVPFTEVLQLVEQRRVFLRDGYAFVFRRDLINWVLSRFRDHLTQKLETTARALPQIQSDRRVAVLLENLAKQAHVSDSAYSSESLAGAVTPSQLDHLAETSFPPCMQNLHKNLRHSHHLRHQGRMQYGLFLKAIGLSLEDALQFWRSEFLRKHDIDSKRFDQEYAYTIKHNYGTVGKRTSYSPYGCYKIITGMPVTGTQDHHGCPFRTFDKAHLDAMLLENRIPGEKRKDIQEKVQGQHYQVACRVFYEAKHNLSKPLDMSITHPNSYYDQSRAHYAEKEGAEPPLEKRQQVERSASERDTSSSTSASSSSSASSSTSSPSPASSTSSSSEPTETHVCQS